MKPSLLCLLKQILLLFLKELGLSGRYGLKGVAINFVKNYDIRILRDIEQYYFHSDWWDAHERWDPKSVCDCCRKNFPGS